MASNILFLVNEVVKEFNSLSLTKEPVSVSTTEFAEKNPRVMSKFANIGTLVGSSSDLSTFWSWLVKSGKVISLGSVNLASEKHGAKQDQAVIRKNILFLKRANGFIEWSSPARKRELHFVSRSDLNIRNG